MSSRPTHTAKSNLAGTFDVPPSQTWLARLTCRQLKNMFNFFKKAKKEPQNLKEVIAELKKLESGVAGLKSELGKIKAADKLHFQKIGFVRYNPFSGVGSDQSFSLALLDENDDGFIITSLFSREGNRVYGKTIKEGNASHPLSEEEKQALNRAISSKVPSSNYQ